MLKIKIPYGRRHISVDIRDDLDVKVVNPTPAAVSKSLGELLQGSLDNPIGTERIETLVRGFSKVTIVVNDHTRPGPTRIILEGLIPRLTGAGIQSNDITFVIATGSHRATTAAELDEIIGPEFRKNSRVLIHDCLKSREIAYMGNSRTGVPIYLNRHVAESDFIITTGLISPHHSAGYSGGRKSIMPGVAGFDSLKLHHSLPYRPSEPAMGFMYGNPFHEIALEAARMVKVKFMINAVQNPLKETIAFVSGDLEKAHEAGVELCREKCEYEFTQQADVVMAGPGGYPRDINLYQAQKALSVAEPLGRPGCTYILLAQAPDGIGEGVLKDWMTEAESPQEVIDRFKREGFDVGSNKAFMFARALTKGRVIIVSDKLDRKELAGMMLEWAIDLETALRMAGQNKKIENIIILPNAVNIIPKIKTG